MARQRPSETKGSLWDHRDPFGMLDCLTPCTQCPLSSEQAVGEREGEGRRPSCGEGAGARSAEGRCQQLQLERPQNTGPMAHSDLPQNQPRGLSLTSWPGHSVTARPPRRVHWPVSPGVSVRGGVTAVPLLPPCSLSPQSPCHTHLGGRRAAGRRRVAPGTKRAAGAVGWPGAQQQGWGGPVYGGSIPTAPPCALKVARLPQLRYFPPCKMAIMGASASLGHGRVK